jgi:hypothetical protein
MARVKGCSAVCLVTCLLEGALIRPLAADAAYVFADVVFGIDICGSGSDACDRSCHRCCWCSLSARVGGAGKGALGGA